MGIAIHAPNPCGVAIARSPTVLWMTPVAAAVLSKLNKYSVLAAGNLARETKFQAMETRFQALK